MNNIMINIMNNLTKPVAKYFTVKRSFVGAYSALFLLGGASLFTGCGGSPSGGAGPDFLASSGRCPRSGFINLDASCCDGGGTQIRFDGICSPATATTPAVAGALTGAATAGQIASNANTAARNMESGATQASTGGIQSAATGVAGLNTVAPDRSNGSPAKGALALSKEKKNKTLGSAGGPSSESGGGGLPNNFGQGSTLPNTGAAQAAALAGMNLDAGGGNFGANGTSGGFRMPGSVGRGPSDDSGISGNAPSASGETDFNGASGLSPIGSLDPEDYFTRLEASDSLFKIVERRYKKTTMNWALLGIGKMPRGEAPKLEIEGLK